MKKPEQLIFAPCIEIVSKQEAKKRIIKAERKRLSKLYMKLKKENGLDKFEKIVITAKPLKLEDMETVGTVN
jgi:hypothetical protein